MLANFGTNVALIAPIQNVLPRMVESAAGPGGKALGARPGDRARRVRGARLQPGGGSLLGPVGRRGQPGGHDHHRASSPAGWPTSVLGFQHSIARRSRSGGHLPGHDQHRVLADVGDRGGPRGPAVLGAGVGADLGRAGGRAHHRPRRGRAGVPLGHRRDDRHLRRLRRLPDPADGGAVPAAQGQLRVRGAAVPVGRRHSRGRGVPGAGRGRVRGAPAGRASARCCRSSRASAWSWSAGS